MVVAHVERQALLLFEKVLSHIYINHKKMIKRGKDRPTKSKIQLTNKSVIHCLPAGDTGYGIMGFTIDLLIADEAAFIPEEVWASITPALAITHGNIWLLSTPKLKEGYYYRCFEDPDFTSFHTSSEDCPRKDQVFLDYQKSWMTISQYAQMYKGEFVDDLHQFFKEELIIKCNILSRSKSVAIITNSCFLGVDVARMGEDESTFEIFELRELNNITHLYQIENQITKKTTLPQTFEHIKALYHLYDFSKIFIDSEGIGVGVYDWLMWDDDTKNITEA
ncbi:hypothetical protein LCGC14_2924860, partial [marine sediment metagenome]